MGQTEATMEKRQPSRLVFWIVVVMKSVPPRGSGWVPEWSNYSRVNMINDPPATAWWYW